MLQKPLPLILLAAVPEDAESRLPQVPMAKLFHLRERVAVGKILRIPGVAPAAKAPWAAHRARRRKQSLRAIRARLDGWCVPGELKAGVFCSVTPFPLDDTADECHPSGKVILRNHGDEYGEPRGRIPLTCPTDLARDLRDLLSARLADWPGTVWMNRAPIPKDFGRELSAWKPFPWVHLEFSTYLWQNADGHRVSKRIREFNARLETILTLWCRLQSW